MQYKIANYLTSIDEKILLNTAINNNLEQQAQAIFKSWFVNTENDKRICCKADEYFYITIGKTPPRKEPEWFSNIEGVRWISISDICIATPFATTS